MSAHDYALTLARKGHTVQSIKQATGVDVSSVVRERRSFSYVAPTPPPPEKYGPPIYTLKMKVDRLIRNVAEDHLTTYEEMMGKRRTRDAAYARHEAMYLLLKQYRLPLKYIGRAIGNRDHSTVLEGIKGHCARNDLDYDAIKRQPGAWSPRTTLNFDPHYRPRTAREYAEIVSRRYA